MTSDPRRALALGIVAASAIMLLAGCGSEAASKGRQVLETCLRKSETGIAQKWGGSDIDWPRLLIDETVPRYGNESLIKPISDADKASGVTYRAIWYYTVKLRPKGSQEEWSQDHFAVNAEIRTKILHIESDPNYGAACAFDEPQ